LCNIINRCIITDGRAAARRGEPGATNDFMDLCKSIQSDLTDLLSRWRVHNRIYYRPPELRPLIQFRICNANNPSPKLLSTVRDCPVLFVIRLLVRTEFESQTTAVGNKKQNWNGFLITFFFLMSDRIFFL